MNTGLRIAGITTGVLLGTVACSGGGSSSGAPESQDTQVNGSGYHLTVSGDQWSDITSTIQKKQSQIDKAYKSGKTSFNVVKTDGAGSGDVTDNKKQQVQAAEQSLRHSGSTNIESHRNTTMDGEGAIQMSSQQSENGQEFYVYQVYAQHDGSGYVLTAGGPTSENKAENLAHELVDTWEWDESGSTDM